MVKGAAANVMAPWMSMIFTKKNSPMERPMVGKSIPRSK